jgi:hypothetical protein
LPVKLKGLFFKATKSLTTPHRNASSSMHQVSESISAFLCQGRTLFTRPSAKNTDAHTSTEKQVPQKPIHDREPTLHAYDIVAGARRAQILILWRDNRLVQPLAKKLLQYPTYLFIILVGSLKPHFPFTFVQNDSLMRQCSKRKKNAIVWSNCARSTRSRSLYFLMSGMPAIMPRRRRLIMLL